ncbi:hypothetical protein Pcinc_017632 [Petrolisthes cinctipes]|uniref:Uncharacterized protein n=1 Tax=Petrolisthes cinctipes TaxID=88211 RepID=A0AAE1KNJ9_PETCI|nr:hypothetical protein Pcinc_017632 [Petrolisthes cinctipes]
MHETIRGLCSSGRVLSDRVAVLASSPKDTVTPKQARNAFASFGQQASTVVDISIAIGKEIVEMEERKTSPCFIETGRRTYWAGAGRGGGQSSAAAPSNPSLPTDLIDGVDTAQRQGSAGHDSSRTISTQLGGFVGSARSSGGGAAAPPSADPSAVAGGTTLGL